jgi:hypothetical protein
VRESKNVGHVYSTVVPDPHGGFQVDYFVRPAELLEPTYHYLSFNDLGNLLGKIYVEAIAAAFPEARLPEALADEREREREAAALRAKFDGERVRAWTGLDGKALGAFLRRFTRTYPPERLASMDAAAIRAAVEGFPDAD